MCSYIWILKSLSVNYMHLFLNLWAALCVLYQTRVFPLDWYSVSRVFYCSTIIRAALSLPSWTYPRPQCVFHTDANSEWHCSFIAQCLGNKERAVLPPIWQRSIKWHQCFFIKLILLNSYIFIFCIRNNSGRSLRLTFQTWSMIGPITFFLWRWTVNPF